MWFSQTATTGWNLYQGKPAHGLGGLPAQSSLLDSFPLKSKELENLENTWGDQGAATKVS